MLLHLMMVLGCALMVYATDISPREVCPLLHPRSPFENMWIKIEVDAVEGPSPRLAHAAAAIAEDYMIVHGGLYGAADQTLEDLWIYAEHEDSWTRIAQKGQVPAPRFHHTLVAIDGRRMLLFGGFNRFLGEGHDSFDDLYELNLVTYTWVKINPVGPRPSKRGAHETAVVGDYMYLFGGFAAIGTTNYLADLWRFNIKKRVWEDLTAAIPAPAPPGRSGFSWLKLHDELIVFGGGCNAPSQVPGQCDDTWALNTTTLRWRNLQPAGATPEARRASHADTHVYGTVFLFGGMQITPGKPPVLLNDFHAYNREENTWWELHPSNDFGSHPPPTFGHSVVRLNHAVVIFGGRVGSVSSPGSSQLWEYRAVCPPGHAPVEEL